MDRREHLRTLVLAGLAGTVLLPACSPQSAEEKGQAEAQATEGYGRTPKEKAHDERILSETYFTPAEMKTLGVLCAIIIPADERSGSALEAGVPDFMEFIVKDIPDLQLPMRGGLAWLDNHSRKSFNAGFSDLNAEQQTSILDAIAYPTEDEKDQTPGHTFFNLARFLTMTGFYTSQIGVMEDLQFTGNYANVWDGVPEDVLAAYEVDYDPEWTAKCLDVSTRNDVAAWDDQGNLI
ncbi:MAG: gluconate 2-dehydrogenase subunit 3 family protein [Saprospiraceae bacterium]|nr:gluconate 2-dehydrogenase subunit 3 family protein [Saprospiraceae bacterium]